jgi:hypothetical protein
MSHVVMILTVWGVITAAFLALLAYNATVTRYEDDQLFLNDNNQQQHQVQDNIQKSVTRTRPFVRAFGGASALLGAAIVGMYTYEAWLRLQ